MTASQSAGDPRWVLLKSTGGAGIGDLVRAVLSALHYAHVTGRALSVQWADGLYGPAGTNVFPHLFELIDVPAADCLDGLTAPADTWPPAWRGRLDWPLNRLYAELRDDDWNRGWALRELSFDQTRFDYAESVLVMWDFDGFTPSWQAADPVRRVGSSPEDALRQLAARHVRPAARIREQVAAFRERHFTRPMMGVHVRKTFEKGGAGKQVNDESYPRAIAAVRRRHPEAGIFLATDNADMVGMIGRRFPGLVTRPKWFPTAGQPIHFTPEGPERLARAEDAVVEMCLLAACDYLIYPALSSFSMAARHLSGLPDARVVALRSVTGPRQWWWQAKRLRALRAGRGLI
ncbi:MAG: nodulation protein NodZ [Chromatiaceae bacterium]